MTEAMKGVPAANPVMISHQQVATSLLDPDERARSGAASMSKTPMQMRESLFIAESVQVVGLFGR